MNVLESITYNFTDMMPGIHQSVLSTIQTFMPIFALVGGLILAGAFLNMLLKFVIWAKNLIFGGNSPDGLRK